MKRHQETLTDDRKPESTLLAKERNCQADNLL